MTEVIHVTEKEARKIAEGRNSLIYYQEKSEFNRPVLFKIIREERNFYPYSTQILNEDQLLRDIEIKGVRKSLGQIMIKGRPAVILDYVEGSTLKEYLQDTTPPFIEQLKIAMAICAALEKVHQQHIIHKDINSHNILINRDQEISLIDFGLASRLNTRSDVKHISDYVAGTLGYISPEQTGRVNHVVDQRSDLYSLGVVLYELFSGQLPFTTQDPMELVHAHLAMEPMPLVEVNPEIPLVISEIVNKLLSKNMESRYQTAGGVLSDMMDCYNQLGLRVSIEEFEIGRKDHSEKFLAPSKLYGREKEVTTLLNSIKKIGKGKESTLITGSSGTGKTSLIYEVYKPLTQKNGYFIQGKFEQFQKDIPYHALVQAFTYLANLMLSESEEKLTYWKTTITDALGAEGKLITDLIPSLELIIGKQRPLNKLGINEAQNRFDYTFVKFIKAIATKDHPLILFVDDLQWADGSSLHLLKRIICDEEVDNFYFIGAYRQNEVDKTHPLTMVVNELKERAIRVNEIKLSELSQKHVKELICETLLLDPSQGEDLAKIVYDKTAGNPFFINQFLQSIYENHLIFFQRDNGDSRWQIDWEGMKKVNFTDNVVEFMIRKIEKLDEEDKEVLKLGACVGDTFDLETLCFISGKKGREMEKCLYRLIEDQYVFLLGENPDYIHLLAKFSVNNGNSNIQYKFTHDRIRQAAYALVPDDQRSEVHLKIGKQMLENIDAEKLNDHIFDIVFHLNNGIKAKMPDELRRDLVALNYQAASKAKSSSAYQNALFHYERCINLLLSWTRGHDRDLKMKVFIGAMECAYLTGDYDRMEELGNHIFRIAHSIYEKLDAYRVTIYSLIARNRYLDATHLGLEVLKKFHVKFPEHPTKLQIVISYLKTSLAIGNKKASHFKNLPPIKDHKALAILEIILSFASAAYHVTPALFPLVVMKMLRLSLKYGTSTELISTYAGYGILLCGIAGKMDDGYDFGFESLKMLESFPDTGHAKSRTKLIVATFINHWKDHLNKSLPLLMHAYRDGLESGDQEFAAGSLFVHSYHSFLLGESLPALLDRMKDFHRKIGQLNQKSYEFYSSIDFQAINNLFQNSENPALLAGDTFDENSFLDNKDGQEMRDDKTALFHYHFFKMTLHYLSGNSEEALSHSEKLKKLDVAMSTPFIPQHVFYDSLIGLALCRNQVSSSSKKKWKNRIHTNQKKLKKWAKHASMNFSHKFSIVEAGMHFVFTGDNQKAQSLFEQGILEASKNDYTNDLAIAYELAGDFYSLLGDNAKKVEHNKKAYAAYQKWGVAIKLKKLVNYSGDQVKPYDSSDITSSTYLELGGDISQLDISTIIKASSAITSEIKLKKLVHQLLKIVAQNAGAQRGVFILNADDEMRVRAVIDDKGKITEPSKDEVKKKQFYSDRIIQFVKRTGENLVIDEAQEDERFADDEYVKSNNCRSILCFPIVSKKNRTGFLFLENNLTTGVFNAKRIKILKLLSGQMAVSLENAMLYDSLEQKVEHRTRELEEQKNELRNKNIELTHLNQEKDDLINVVSHDLRSPLNQVKGLAQITSMETSDPKVKNYAEKMIEATDRLNNMITRILDISAIEAQKIELRIEQFDAISQVNRVVDSFMQTAGRKQINLKVTANAERGMISLDKNFFIQVLENLLSNAIKFSPAKGEVEVIMNYHKKGIKIEVKDNGPGIDEEDQKKLFNKFQKLSAKPTGGEKSTGLGLAIVKRYVDAMGGKIWCESMINQGTSFFVEFPKG